MLAPFAVRVAVVPLQITELLVVALTTGIGFKVKVIMVGTELQLKVLVPITLSVVVVTSDTDGEV